MPRAMQTFPFVRISALQRAPLFDRLTWKIKLLRPFETSGDIYKTFRRSVTVVTEVDCTIYCETWGYKQ